MRDYEVTVLYTARKTVNIHAKSEDAAMREADKQASLMPGFLEIQETGVKPQLNDNHRRK